LNNLVWQLHDENEWRFGKMVRGVVRKPYYAEIYFNDAELASVPLGEPDDGKIGWVWFTHIPGRYDTPRGLEGTFEIAVSKAEKVLMEAGILEHD